jgi:hypothetical protein
VAAARLDRAVLTDIQLAREREFIRHLTRAQRAAGDERRRWRSIPDVHVPFEPRRSEA